MSLTFLVFADFHYKEGMYASTVADLKAILRRAKESGAEMILHAGDLCNDYPGSPEVTELLLHAPCALPVYGCYGNHELETAGTAMTFVTPLLTNRPVIRDTDAAVGYYYTDLAPYRLVVLDTNYSLAQDGTWEHNRTGSYGSPAENTRSHSLGPEQLAWLDGVLTDAAARGLCCIVLSHAAFDARRRDASPDAPAVRQLFAKANAQRKGTVMLAINGHYHTDGLLIEDDVIYFDVNAVRNGWWAATPHEKYRAAAPTFPFVPYDRDGKPLAEPTQRPVLTLGQGKRTLFTCDPLCAVVRIDGDTVTVEGCESQWLGGCAPDTTRTDILPAIRSRAVSLKP